MKHLFRTLTSLVLSLAIVACNTDYNFDNISLEVTVGDTEGIAVPLGSTGEITLGSLLEEAGLETNDDGFYGFNFTDGLEHTIEVGNLDPITGLVPTISPISSELYGALSVDNMPTLGGDAYTKALDFPEGISANATLTEALLNLLPNKEFQMHYDPHTFEAEIDVTLPEQVAGIQTITFGANGEGSVLDMQFDLGGLYGVCETCVIENFNIELPAGFTLAKRENDPIGNYITISKGTGSNTPNHFQISNYTMTGSHLTVDIVIKSVDLSHVTIGSDQKLKISENVTFDLDFSGTLKAGTVSATSPYVTIAAEGMTLHSASILTNEISHEMSFSESISEVIEVPDVITAIDYLAISKVGAPEEAPEFKVAVELAGAPINELQLQDVVIDLPAFLDIEAPEGWNYADGKLTASTLTVHNNQHNNIIDLTIKGIKSLPIADGWLTLDSTIGLSAKAAIAEGSEIKINTSAQNLSLTPIVTLDDIAIKSVTGRIEPDLGDLLEPQEISLGDVTSSLGDAELELNIESPLLSVSVENPIGVGIDATITLTAYKGEDVAMTITTPTLSILPAGEEAVTTTLHIAGDNSRIPEGAEGTTVIVPELSELIASLPDKIVVALNATTSEGSHTIVLKDSYTFKVDYSVDAAFKFDAANNGRIGYTAMIEDVDLSSLADIDVIVESLVLNVATESTLPIDLGLDVEFLDENDNPIECITSATTGKIEGSTSAEAKQSECSITLNIATPEGTSPFAEIAKTKKVRCKLNGTTLAGGGLKPEQYIVAKLSLLLDKGITIDLGSLLPEGEPSPEE